MRLSASAPLLSISNPFIAKHQEIDARTDEREEKYQNNQDGFGEIVVP
jgi:hypothetical protein